MEAALLIALAFPTVVRSQSSLVDRSAQPKEENVGKFQRGDKPQKGSTAETGSGIGSVAGGAAKGAGNAAAGAGKGALDLATLHPIDAGAAVGVGAAKAGKDFTVGSARGAGKIGKGIGRALKNIL